MAKEADNRTKLLMDADVGFHFLFADELGNFHTIYPDKQLIILDVVYSELTVSSKYKTQIDNYIQYGFAKFMPFPEDDNIKKTYAELIKEHKDPGESACMAVAKHQGCQIASSNWTDIYDFCEEHEITHYSTLDFLYTACAGGKGHIYTVEECEYFIAAVKGKRGKIKFSMKEYIEMVKKGHRSDLYGDQ